MSDLGRGPWPGPGEHDDPVDEAARWPLRIVLIAAAPGSRGLIESLLRQGCARPVEITHCLGPAEFFDLYGALSPEAESIPEVILLDLGSFGAGGIDALARVQDLACRTPIVAVSEDPDIEVAIDAIARGAQDYLVKAHLDAHSLGRAILYAIERHQAELAVAHHAGFDPVTRLATYDRFLDALGRDLAAARRYGHAVAVLHVRLRGLEGLGAEPEQGQSDQGGPLGVAMTGLAERLRTLVRNADLVARFGRNELILLCEGERDGDDARFETLADRIAEVLSGPVWCGQGEREVNACCGIASTVEGHAEPDALLAAALRASDDAMSHGASFEHQRDCESPIAAARSAGSEAIEQAIAADELYLELQTQIEVSSGRLVAVEALPRWARPDGPMLLGMTSQGRSRLAALRKVDEWMLQRLCRLAVDFAEGPAAGIELAARLSTWSFLAPGFVDRVLALLDRYPVARQVLAIEVAEESIGIDRGLAAAVMRRLREEAGLRLLLDRYGAGRSSLATLRTLPLDGIKLHHSLLSRAGGAEGNDILIATVSVGHAFGLRVIADGVTDIRDLDLVHAAGCDRAQGILVAEPLRPEAFLAGLLEGPPGEQ